MRAQTVKPRKSILWVLVADGRHMQVYEGQREERLIPMKGLSKYLHHEEKTEWKLAPLPDMAAKAEPLTDFQAGHDKRGSVLGPTPAARNTAEERLDIRDEVKSDFMRAVAAKLKRAHDEGRFGHLIIVSPPRMLGELREFLAPAVAKCVTAELRKELGHCNAQQLMEHVRSVLMPSKAQAA